MAIKLPEQQTGLNVEKSQEKNNAYVSKVKNKLTLERWSS